MRIGNRIKAGFYPTPVLEVGQHLVKLFELEETQDPNLNQAWLDPCAGTGEILQYFADMHSKENTVHTFGVELDAKRYEECKKRLDVSVRSAFEQMMISHNYFSLIYLNPPYNHEMKVNVTEKAELMELSFLRRSHLYLKEDGILVYVVPANRFAMPEVHDFLAKNYENIGMMRFDDDNNAYEQFKQCIFIGKKRKKERNDTYYNDKFVNFCKQMDEQDFVKKQVTPVSVLVGKKKWIVPQTRKLDKFTFATRVDFKSSFTGISQSDGIAVFKRMTRKSKSDELLSQEKTPTEQIKMPISAGQLGLCLVTGMASGVFGEEETLHIAQGSENVYYEHIFEEKEKTTKGIVRQKRRAKFIIATPDGTVTQLI